ncbi:putative peptide maturation dehydrogenase [Pseudoxanthomonas wuyuanensis]|uniref:Putative peptide maturation dehydrogenase n=1 Tax=Pseudoxanthomonas wuyuanensis TaxID=1073196 RepID=A0A286D880_9GAMM|nr:putative peptide maturation dehydrogenase [Pseudoxanthomonas wuyuanensis]KAF1718844.1 putative peptide maturation dehydrogenase [Pseudoxanthomonas wuyuanensis]SOD54860.1 putative peptide maturation dehydrogenase [Pseudoxanthomonas wuyuanensis]
MRVRRCKVLYLEPREQVEFDLEVLLAGGSGLVRERRWLALAPHLGQEIEVDAHERELLGALSPDEWTDSRQLSNGASTALKRLLKTGLVVANGKRHAVLRERDEALRDVYWHPLAATLHAFTRWQDADAVKSMQDTGTETAGELREVLGPPPAEAVGRGHAGQRLALPRTARNDFDALLARRATCRNFDAERPLPYALFAQLMERVFAAQSHVRVSDDTVFLKKTSPSGGGLHPIEAYLIVQNVEGVVPGLYHYHAIAHALEPLLAPEQPLHELAMSAVAEQHWFANAHVMVLMAPRYDRNFWKYRNHAKAYRAIALEAGHLSQTLYLSATDAGLGAYITCAINEVPLEQVFGLDHVSEGALAICGFGWRGEEMVTMELDPAGEIWNLEETAGQDSG